MNGVTLRRAITFTLIVSSALGLASCAGSARVERHVRRDACALLTDHDAVKVLGVATYPAENDTDRSVPATGCRWVAKGSDRQSGSPAYALWIEEGRGLSDRRRFGQLRTSAAGEPIDLLGHDAVVTTGDMFTGEPGAGLEFRVGPQIISIWSTGDDGHPVSPSEARTLDIRAARLVIHRLS